MKRDRFMIVAGETSGDILASELVQAMRIQLAGIEPERTADHQPLNATLAPEFFGAGGPRMAAAGVHLLVDMTRHSATGLSDVLKKLLEFRRIFFQLKRAALERLPDIIVCVDFSGFNRRWIHAIRKELRRSLGPFNNWEPKVVQYVSPQVWASRESRIYSMEENLDLLLTLFPFEKDWYARRVPKLRVEFVGHPMLDRYAIRPELGKTRRDELLLLPGSRLGELARHLPVLFAASDIVRRQHPSISVRMVVPSDALLAQAHEMRPPQFVVLQVGGLPEALSRAKVAIASTGTVTMECALFGVPTVALYKTSWSTYQIGKRLVKVKYLAMPNILADSPVFPEFIQDTATPGAIAGAALELLTDEMQRKQIETRLGEIVATLGKPGASRRAANYIISLR